VARLAPKGSGTASQVEVDRRRSLKWLLICSGTHFARANPTTLRRREGADMPTQRRGHGTRFANEISDQEMLEQEQQICRRRVRRELPDSTQSDGQRYDTDEARADGGP